jgi:hypothetical protein
MTLTMAFSIVGFALTVVQANNGAGRHRGDVPPDTYQYGLFINFVFQPIYLFAICFVKLAVGAALMRIANEKVYKRLIMGVMGFMLFYTIACFFVSIAFILVLCSASADRSQTVVLQCTNLQILWNPETKATCWSPSTIRALSYTNAALNIFTDLLFSIVIPLPMLWRLHVNFRTWVTLMCILGLGVFACAAASVKVTFLPNYGKQGDFLWDSRNITIWVATELNVAITAASLPCLKPLFKTVLGSTYGRGTRGSNSNQRRGRKSWHALSDAERKSSKKDTLDSSESQTALELESCGSQAFVHSKSGTTTEIGQADLERRESNPDELSALPLPQHPEKNILTTTTMSVRYSER